MLVDDHLACKRVLTVLLSGGRRIITAIDVLLIVSALNGLLVDRHRRIDCALYFSATDHLHLDVLPTQLFTFLHLVMLDT